MHFAQASAIHEKCHSIFKTRTIKPAAHQLQHVHLLLLLQHELLVDRLLLGQVHLELCVPPLPLLRLARGRRETHGARVRLLELGDARAQRLGLCLRACANGMGAMWWEARSGAEREGCAEACRVESRVERETVCARICVSKMRISNKT